jgi:DNA-binding MarR family transcriptional regulator
VRDSLLHERDELHLLLHKGDEFHLLLDVVRTQQTVMAGFARRVGMPSSHFALMHLLGLSREGAGVMSLARRLGINPAAVTRLVKVFEEDGLIDRRDDPRDSRRSYVRLSPKGAKVFRQLHERARQLAKAVSSTVSSDDIAVAVRVLAEVREVFHDDEHR